MEMWDSDENPKGRITAEQQLLQEGVPSYFDAMMAIQELRQTIQRRCRRILRERLGEFARAVGVPLHANEIKDYAEPERVSALATTDWAHLGVTIPLRSDISAYIALVWTKEDGQDDQSPAIWAYVAIACNDQDRVNRMWDIANKVAPDVVKDDAWTIGLYKPVPPDRIPNFDAILSDLLEEWSRLWQVIGGLPE